MLGFSHLRSSLSTALPLFEESRRVPPLTLHTTSLPSMTLLGFPPRMYIIEHSMVDAASCFADNNVTLTSSLLSRTSPFCQPNPSTPLLISSLAYVSFVVNNAIKSTKSPFIYACYSCTTYIYIQISYFHPPCPFDSESSHLYTTLNLVRSMHILTARATLALSV